MITEVILTQRIEALEARVAELEGQDADHTADAAKKLMEDPAFVKELSDALTKSLNRKQRRGMGL
jgi:cell division septum initiation protein DivIVA